MYLRISLTEEAPDVSKTDNVAEHIFNCIDVPQDEMIDYYETVIDPTIHALADKIRADHAIDLDDYEEGKE